MFSIVSLPVLGPHFVNHPSLLDLQLQVHEFFQVESSIINCCNNIYFVGSSSEVSMPIPMPLSQLGCSLFPAKWCHFVYFPKFRYCLVLCMLLFGCDFWDCIFEIRSFCLCSLCYFDFVILCSVSQSYPPSLKSVCTDMHIKKC